MVASMCFCANADKKRLMRFSEDGLNGESSISLMRSMFTCAEMPLQNDIKASKHSSVSVMPLIMRYSNDTRRPLDS